MLWFMLACAVEAPTPGDTADAVAHPFAPDAIECAEMPSELRGEIPPSLTAREGSTVVVSFQLLGWGVVCEGGCPAGATWEVSGAEDPVWSISIDDVQEADWCWIETSTQRFQVWVEPAP